MYKTFIELDPSDTLKLKTQLENKNLVEMVAVVNGVEKPLKIKGTIYDLNYFVDGKQEFRWNIEKIICRYEYDNFVRTGHIYTFDPPINLNTLKNKDIPHGKYLCKFVNKNNMELVNDILNHRPKCSSVGGSFVFDLDYLLLEMVELS